MLIRIGSEKKLKTLVKSNDPVLVGYVTSLLDGEEIVHFVLDSNMSIMEGSVGILPRRVMVADDEIGHARTILHDAGLGHECADRDG